MSKGKWHLRLVEVVEHDAKPESSKHEQEVEDGVLPSADFLDQCECDVAILCLSVASGRVGNVMLWLVPRDWVGRGGDRG